MWWKTLFKKYDNRRGLCAFVMQNIMEFDKISIFDIITARKGNLGQGSILTGFVCLQGVSVWCHFLSGCLVPCSFQGGVLPLRCGVCLQESLPPGGRRYPSPEPEKRAVRILLECFLVDYIEMYYINHTSNTMSDEISFNVFFIISPMPC